MSSRTRWIDVARGFGVLGIVLTHAAAWSPAPLTPGGQAVLALAPAALPLFFLLSGVLARRGVVDQDATLGSLARRITPLLVLFAVWQPVVFAYRLLGAAVLDDPVDLGSEVVRVVAAPIRPNGELWYLWALAIYLWLAHVTRRLPALPLLVVSGAVFVLVHGWGAELLGADLWHVLGPGLQGLPQFFFWTLLGLRCATALTALTERSTLASALATTAIWLATLVVAPVTPEPLSVPVALARTALGIVSILTMSHLLAGRAVAAPLEAIGRRSLVPYLLHTTVIVVLVAVATWTGLIPTLQGMPDLTLAVLVIAGSIVPIAVAALLPDGVVRFAFAPRLPGRAASAA